MSNPFQSPSANLELLNSAENNSGGGSAIDIPPGVKGWSWGAFFLNWIWAVFNKTWIGLLCLIPYIGFVVSIYLGVKGRELAWKNKRWDDLEHFNRVQRKWTVWSLILVFGLGGLGIVAAISIPAYQQYVQRSKEAAKNKETPPPSSISDTRSQKPSRPIEKKDIPPSEPLTSEPKTVAEPLPSLPPPVAAIQEPVKNPPPQALAPVENTENPTQNNRPPKHSGARRNHVGASQLNRCLDYQTNLEIAKCVERIDP